MTDIKAIAATYAARIFDRMEMCRGSAILKSDIEREVEMALRELAADYDDGEIEGLSDLESEFCTVISEHTVKGADAYFAVMEAGPAYGVSPARSALPEMSAKLVDVYERTLKHLAEKTVDPPELRLGKQEVSYRDVPNAVKQRIADAMDRRGNPAGVGLIELRWFKKFIPGDFIKPRDRWLWVAKHNDFTIADMSLAEDA